MVEMIAQKYSFDIIQNVVECAKMGYADTLYMNLDISKIRAIGWEPRTNLAEMFDRMISFALEQYSLS